MGTLIAGSSNLLTYKTYVDDVLTQAATIAVVPTGTTAPSGFAGTPTWVAGTGYTLELTPADVPVAAIGECWDLTWTWTSGGDTFRDVDHAYIVESESDTLLATKADLGLYGYDVAAYTMLARASLRVRRYARQTISRVTGDVVSNLEPPYLLPQRPVVSVASVVDDDDVTLVAGTDYTLRGPYLDMNPRHGPVTVTYTHGFLVPPDEIRDVVCAVAARLANAPEGLVNGAQSDSGGGEGITWGANAYEGVADLTPGEKRIIDRYLALKTGRSVDIL